MVVKLKRVRLAFPALYQPKAVNAGDKPAFSATFLIAKGDSQVKGIEEALEHVAKEQWKDKAVAVLKALKAGDKICLHDGDTKAQYDGFDGCVYVSARNVAKPGVFDRDRTELAESSGKPYAGCYVNAQIDIWAQDNNYGKRINATLKGVQFDSDGDAFVGSAPATADDFDDVGDTGEESLV